MIIRGNIIDLKKFCSRLIWYNLFMAQNNSHTKWYKQKNTMWPTAATITLKKRQTINAKWFVVQTSKKVDLTFRLLFIYSGHGLHHISQSL